MSGDTGAAKMSSGDWDDFIAGLMTFVIWAVPVFAVFFMLALS